ncbi:MAG: hypothetical protein F6J98_22430 [Moorea sp. SIO4G2]|nr:hypothetical protein [Moorena sp. SIO4G2]
MSQTLLNVYVLTAVAAAISAIHNAGNRSNPTKGHHGDITYKKKLKLNAECCSRSVRIAHMLTNKQ